MANLRKHSTEQLWRILYNTRVNHEGSGRSIMQMLADLIIGQQAIIGILNRQKIENEKNALPRTRFGTARITYRYNQPEGLAGGEETPNVAYPTIGHGHSLASHGAGSS